ncbi:MAG TPA: TfoX/Sxy family protein [Acidobacteriota bacterium]|nr:TfoX/Sxy family protein [Acidobacteriota bacterium]
MKKSNPKGRAVSSSKSPSSKRAGQAGPPKWQKSPAQLVELFARLQAGLPPEAEKRKMFGYPCSFVNGQMFAGLHQTNMVLRLGEEDRAEFLRQAGAEIFEPMPGRIMKEYVVVPASLKREEEVLLKWTVRAFSYAKSLGPKVKKKSR